MREAAFVTRMTIILIARYRTARSAKVDFVQNRYASYSSRVEIVPIDDLIHGDYTAALKGKIVIPRWDAGHLYNSFAGGVEGLIHAASPLAGRSATNEE